MWLAESPAFEAALRRAPLRLSSRPFRALALYKQALFTAAKVARKVKLEASSVNLKVSQRVALFKLVTAARQDHDRIGFLVGLDPALGGLVRFTGGRWVSVGLEEDTRAHISSLAVATHRAKPSNVVRTLAEKVPSSRPQLGPLRVSPDDVPATGPIDKSSVTKAYWSKVWAKRAPVPVGVRAGFLEGYNKKADLGLCVRPDLEAVVEIINRPNSSAPGPDGIPMLPGGLRPTWLLLSSFASSRLFLTVTRPLTVSTMGCCICSLRRTPVSFLTLGLLALPTPITGCLLRSLPAALCQRSAPWLNLLRGVFWRVRTAQNILSLSTSFFTGPSSRRLVAFSFYLTLPRPSTL